MTPKEKAKELYNRFEIIFINANADSWGKEAKECALIAVDEIIKEHTEIENADAIGYWVNVRTEINKL